MSISLSSNLSSCSNSSFDWSGWQSLVGYERGSGSVHKYSAFGLCTLSSSVAEVRTHFNRSCSRRREWCESTILTSLQLFVKWFGVSVPKIRATHSGIGWSTVLPIKGQGSPNRVLKLRAADSDSDLMQ